MRFYLCLLFSAVLYGCVGPLVPVIDVDKESSLRLQKEVLVYNIEDLKSTEYKRIQQIQATSCMNKLYDPPASRENAIDQLRYKASALGGNGLTNVMCEGREGTNLAKNCWSSVTCYAVAIGVRSERTAGTKQGTPQKVVEQSSGTGFVVSAQGHVLTNQHVVEGCGDVTAVVSGVSYRAKILRTDFQNDLALLMVEGITVPPLSFRSGVPLRAGEEVVVVGFPLSGILAQEPHVTTGSITALAGIRDDTRFLQMSAPVQPGNSGGPLLDKSGHVVGIVVGKLDALRVAVVTGDIPQNVNFALNGLVAKAFLDASGVNYGNVESTSYLKPADVAENARKSTVLLQCTK